MADHKGGGPVTSLNEGKKEGRHKKRDSQGDSWQDDEDYDVDGGVTSGLSSPVQSPTVSPRPSATNANTRETKQANGAPVVEGGTNGPTEVRANAKNAMEEMDLEHAIEEVAAVRTEQDEHVPSLPNGGKPAKKAASNVEANQTAEPMNLEIKNITTNSSPQVEAAGAATTISKTSSNPVICPPAALAPAPQLLSSAVQISTGSAMPSSTPTVAVMTTPVPTHSSSSNCKSNHKRTPVSKSASSKRSITDREDFKRYGALTRDKLRQELKVRGLSVSGTKADLLQRLVDSILKREREGISSTDSASTGSWTPSGSSSDLFSPFSSFAPTVSTFSHANGESSMNGVRKGHRRHDESDDDVTDEDSQIEIIRRSQEIISSQKLARSDRSTTPRKRRRESAIPLHLRTDERYYYCRHCEKAWPKTSFKNAQQFGAHCSNCARRHPGKVLAPVPFPDLVNGQSHSRKLRGSNDLVSSRSLKFIRNLSQPMALGRMKAENRSIFLWFDALPTDLILRIFSFLGTSLRDIGAVSASCHFFSIIAASDSLWRKFFEARWNINLASRYTGTWKERFASRILFLKARVSLPAPAVTPSNVSRVTEEEGTKLKELWNSLLEDPKIKTRRIETVLATASSSAEETGTTAPRLYLVQWTATDQDEQVSAEDRQRWVAADVMTAAPVISLPGCAAVNRRKTDGPDRTLKRTRPVDEYSSESDDGCGPRKRMRGFLDESDDSENSSDFEDNDSDASRRKFEEGPLAKEARLRREQLRREKRARRRRRSSQYNDGSNSNNDDVPLTREDKEQQQKNFLQILYTNRDYKPVVLFFE